MVTVQPDLFQIVALRASVNQAGQPSAEERYLSTSDCSPADVPLTVRASGNRARDRRRRPRRARVGNRNYARGVFPFARPPTRTARWPHVKGPAGRALGQAPGPREAPRPRPRPRARRRHRPRAYTYVVPRERDRVHLQGTIGARSAAVIAASLSCLGCAGAATARSSDARAPQPMHWTDPVLAMLPRKLRSSVLPFGH